MPFRGLPGQHLVTATGTPRLHKLARSQLAMFQLPGVATFTHDQYQNTAILRRSHNIALPPPNATFRIDKTQNTSATLDCLALQQHRQHNSPTPRHGYSRSYDGAATGLPDYTMRSDAIPTAIRTKTDKLKPRWSELLGAQLFFPVCEIVGTPEQLQMGCGPQLSSMGRYGPSGS